MMHYVLEGGFAVFCNLLRVAITSLITVLGSTVLAQGSFPTKPVTIVVPLAPGGGGDIVARLLAPKMQALLGQPVVVQNQPGGATVLGTAYVARAAPDGYTLLMATSSHAINGNFVKLPFDATKDFAGVCLIGTTPLVLVVNASSAATTFAELMKLARSSPQGMTYASSGLGSMPHLSGEMMSRAGGMKLTHVPYKGSAPAEADLLGGHVDMYFAGPPSVVGYVNTGRLRALAVTGNARMPIFPDVPTVADFIPGFDASSFYAILAPAGTPPAIVAKLNEAIKAAAAAPGVREQLIGLGIAPVLSAPADTLTYVDFQIQSWQKVVKEGNIKAE